MLNIEWGQIDPKDNTTWSWSQWN